MAKLCKFIYLASPYTHPDKDVETQRYERITKIAADLTVQHGHCFFLPIVTSHQMVLVDSRLKGSFDNWRDIDLCALDHSDELWVVKMPYWKDSTGVQAEIAYAKEAGIPIRFLEDTWK